ncbi:MAG: methyl-accepting chemotaxis protein [Propionivibrio sp.]|jgi:methyl-accepting chemotaxis protein|nr:methyl-accepting chemotaxis protein [Propionivibrio sp.]MBP6710114.1 methyl-accepting chemotaxis protein [Propionivibrio sp.]MBP7524524.1 methyl-accepting chemotaxis protein [Propionivibrio sp.]
MKLTISRQLSLMALVTIAILLVVGIIGNRVASSINSAVENSEKIVVPTVESIGTMRLAFLDIQVAVPGHIAAYNEGEKKDLDARITASQQTFAATLDDYEKIAASSGQKNLDLLAADRKAYEDFVKFLTPVLEKSRNSEVGNAKELFNEGKPIITKLNESLVAHAAYSKELASEQSQSAAATFAGGNTLLMVSSVLGMLFLGGLSFVLNRSISRGLASMEQTVARVEAELDLTARVPVRRDDEIGKMGVALNRLLDRLQANLKTVAQMAGHLSQSADNLSEASRQVADSSEAQSSAASSMAAGVEELTVSINHVGDRATHTRERVAYAGKLATEGEGVVVKTVEDIDAIALSVSSSAELINRLETQSREIASVVNVIKEVADQTNLLALNAAIEAARAGEQGRGFAVVADEVRKLAERTGNSTREITDTISVMRDGAQAASSAMMNAVEQVTASVSRASGACDMIRKIGEGSREAVGMVSEITDAIHEQSASSTSVAQSVERIAQMAEQSTAAAQGSADTAQQLNTLAQEMRLITDQYKL